MKVKSIDIKNSLYLKATLLLYAFFAYNCNGQAPFFKRNALSIDIGGSTLAGIDLFNCLLSVV